jgi:enterochelin esterase-like enzyme
MSHSKKSKWILALLSSALIGCTSTQSMRQATSPPSPTACQSAGEVQPLNVAAIGQIGLYLPPCYNPGGGSLYPVLYLFPGVGGSAKAWIEAGLTARADEAILQGEIPPFLIVMTDDTLENISLDTIVGTLIPNIESHYPVRSDRFHRAVAGGSLGGYFAYALAFQHPELFASAGVFGCGLITGMEEKTRDMLHAIPPEQKPRVFLNSGESDTYMLQHAQMLIPLLDESGIEHTEIFSPGDHSYEYWLSNFPAYFRWLARDWK